MDVTRVNSLPPRALASLSGAAHPGLLSRLPPAEQRRAVAGQFEAIMVRQLLQESVGGMLGGAEGGPSGNIYGYLLTDVLATKLAEGGGLGLGRLLQQQLAGRAASAGNPDRRTES